MTPPFLNADQSIPEMMMLQVTHEAIFEFSEVSEDRNPIHFDAEFAKKLGLPGRIAHGMLLSGAAHSRALIALREEKPLRGFTLLSSQIKFRAPVFLGDEIRIGGHFSIASGTEIIVHLSARNQTGLIVLAGQWHCGPRTEPTPLG